MGQREPLANTCVLLPGRWNIYWPISEFNCLSGVEKSRRYCFVSPVPVWQCVNSGSAAKLNASPAKTNQVCSHFCPKDQLHNEIRNLGFGRHLEFHFYLSIMHEVAEIRPRSARLPGSGTPINTTTLICLSHSRQPCTTLLQWLHGVRLRP